MANTALQEHYDRKYHEDQFSEAIPEIARTRIPVDRFEAAVKFVPQIFRGGDVLELGAGNGSVAKALLSSELRIRSYTLSDFSANRLLGMQRSLADPRVSIAAIDAESIPADGMQKYDLVVMIALIEHLIDPLRAMKNIGDLLRPGGLVYIDTPNIAKFTRRAKLLLGRFPSTASKNEGLTTYNGNPADLYDEGHLHYFTYRSLGSMLVTRCGYSSVKKFGYPLGPSVFGKRIHGWLAAGWPEMFSELVLVAYR